MKSSLPSDILADMKRIGARIRHVRNILGLKQAGFGRLIGVSGGAVSNWERNEGIKTENLMLISKRTGVAIDWLAEGKGREPQSKADLVPLTSGTAGEIAVTSAPIKGTVAAGMWLESDDENHDNMSVPIVPGGYVKLDQFAYRVSGSSADLLKIFDGDFVICVSFSSVRPSPQQNDVVVVEQRRGDLVERTCKQVRITPAGAIELWPRSSDPRYQSPIDYKNGSDSVEIVALVVGAYRPIST